MAQRRKYTLLNEQTLANLKAYRYAGGDLSYIYKYINGPLAEFCVSFLPRTIACVPRCGRSVHAPRTPRINANQPRATNFPSTGPTW